ncbi:MAG: hypothetical protein HZY79_02075 [Rhodoblastus sp.]|nr:MAG: hypothetical protein HZY79_02075 [Rhodoblastus sp.]
MFPLDQELVFALNEAKDVEVSLYRNDSQEWLSPVVASRVNLTLRGADFAKALAAGSAPAGGR